MNDLLYSGAALLTEILGIKVREQQKEKKNPGGDEGWNGMRINLKKI